LQKVGYTGNVTDKMYKSIRYYHYKKKEKLENTQKEGSIKETKNRKYMPFRLEILNTMDKQIKELLEKDARTSPAQGFIQYFSSHKTLLEEEKNTMEKEWQEDEWIKKCKKTYKNRFFNYCQTK